MAKFVFFLLFLLYAEVLSESSPSPVFFWTDSLRFKGQNVEVLENLDSSDVQLLVESVVGIQPRIDWKLSRFVQLSSKPEAIIIFMEHQLRTDVFSQLSDAHGTAEGGAFANLKKIMENSVSSLVAPYMNLEESFSASIREVVHEIEGESEVQLILPRDELDSHSLRKAFGNQVKIISHDDFLSDMISKPLGNKMKFFIVGFSEKEDVVTAAKSHDNLVGQMSLSLKTKTNGNFIGIYTADQAVVEDWKFAKPTINVEDFLYRRYAEAVQQTTTAAPTKPVPSNATLYSNHWPPEVWEGLLVSAVLLIILFIGMCCTCDIQSPKTFGGEHKKRD